MLGLSVNTPTQVTLPAGEASMTVRAIRNPAQPERDRLLTAIQPSELEDD